MSENPQSVTRAGPEHAARLIVSATFILLEEAVQPVSEARVTGLVVRCVNQDGAIAGLITGPDGIEASVGLSIERYPYSEAQHLRVQWLGVHEDYRKGDHHTRLLEFSKWAAETVQLPLFATLTTTADLDGKFHSILRRIPQIGAVFSWGPMPDGVWQQRFVGEDPAYKLRRRRHAAAV
jgi:hypothetical protein